MLRYFEVDKSLSVVALKTCSTLSESFSCKEILFYESQRELTINLSAQLINPIIPLFPMLQDKETLYSLNDVECRLRRVYFAI